MLKKGGTLLHLPGTTSKPPTFRKDPSNIDNQIGILDLTTCKNNIIKILQNRNKYESHWHAINDGGNNACVHY